MNTLQMLKAFLLATITVASTTTLAASLEQTDWELNQLKTYKTGAIPQIGRALSLGFNQGMVYGFNGCNNFNTAYQSNEHNTTLKINTQRMTSTLMACMPQMDAVSKAFDQVLKQTSSYKQTDNQLTLKDKTGKTLAQFTKPLTALPNTQWRVVSYNSGNALVSSLNSERMTADFGKKGQLSGFAGCNQYTSSYTVDTSQGTIKIAPIGSTKKFCTEPDSVMKEEQAFLNAWKQVRSYQRLGNVLNLFDHKGTRMLSLSLIQ
jgi:heat shock protein HslJ